MLLRFTCLVVLAAACAEIEVDPEDDAGNARDASRADGAVPSDSGGGPIDAGSRDAGPRDSGTLTDASQMDASQMDAAQMDAAQMDASQMDATIPTPGPLSDDFNGTSLSASWSVFKSSQAQIAVSGGELHMTATENSVWYQSDTGPALFKNVTGNFRMTSSVRVRSVVNPSLPPPLIYQFGGLLARNPSSASENWVFAVIGERNTYLALESKTTVNGQSTINAPDWGSPDAEIRICRVGATFLLLARHPGATAWIEQGTHQRSDMPATLEVGPIVYAYTNTPDIRASFDRVEIVPVSTLADCQSP